MKACNLTDEDFRAIGGLTNLEFVCVQDKTITDSGAAHLHNLKGLQVLYLDLPKLTDRGLKDLRQALEPKRCDISISTLTGSTVADSLEPKVR